MLNKKKIKTTEMYLDYKVCDCIYVNNSLNYCNIFSGVNYIFLYYHFNICFF